MELYRRHSADCKHKSKGSAYTKCNCPIWVDARPKFRRSLGTRDWQRAIRKLDKIATGESATDSRLLSEAVKLYLEDCAARGLRESTLISYTNTLEELRDHFQPLTEVVEIAPSMISRYRQERKIALSSQRKELEHIRAFFWWCVHQHWITDNPSKRIKAPAAQDPPTLPYEPEEVVALLDACGRMENFNTASVERAKIRARALVLLLLYSGFRVSDAVRLERSKLRADGRLLVRTMKTGKHLYIKLPPVCLESLAALPKESEYFFWSGTADLDTALKSARRTIACLGRITGINAHPHRFRDTFAVELLLKGTDIRTVQLLLGHKSLKTTELHYAPWVQRMQQIVDEALEKLSY